MSRVLHFSIINCLLTRLSQVLTLCGLEYGIRFLIYSPYVDYTIMFILF